MFEKKAPTQAQIRGVHTGEGGHAHRGLHVRGSTLEHETSEMGVVFGVGGFCVAVLKGNNKENQHCEGVVFKWMLHYCPCHKIAWPFLPQKYRLLGPSDVALSCSA